MTVGQGVFDHIFDERTFLQNFDSTQQWIYKGMKKKRKIFKVIFCARSFFDKFILKTMSMA